MLIDLKRQVIFVAGLKTGSSTIERLFSPTADIRLTRSMWGKHDSVAVVERKFKWIFDSFPLDAFFVWGVIRDPHDWVWSLYTSHKDPKFADRADVYTGNMDFAQFYSGWRRRNRGQCTPQCQRFKDTTGNLRADLLIDFDRLESGIELVAAQLGVRTGPLPHLNKSPPVAGKEDDFFDLHEQIAQDYAEDLALYQQARMR